MRIVSVSATDPDPERLREAADLLRAGRLVAFPTETVYGLGANALDAAAVRRIFEAKGRPSQNPLIVHVSEAEAARELASEWNDAAEALARTFWPGPLTIVVPKRNVVPDIVTAALNSVGLRVPAHPVALALLSMARIPLAAPSANRATELSPTSAEHVARSLGDRIDLIIDGGQTTVGIESTVVDVSGGVPRVLRPGMISREAIERAVGTRMGALPQGGVEPAGAPRSPGLLGRHYAPKAALVLFSRATLAAALDEARAALNQSRRVGAMVFDPIPLELEDLHVMPPEPQAYARMLYSTLHALDHANCDVVLVERPPDEPEWAAINDRLARAATSK